VATDDVEVVGDLLDVIGGEAADHDDYCGERGTYRRWEQEVAIPRLETLGYTVQRIYTGDGDSFGPLTRMFVVTKNGVEQELM